MKIQLNGEPFTLEDEQTIAGLIASIDVGAKRYAIEVNEAIIPRSQYAEYSLSAGDVVEVVVAIGGG